MFSSGTRPRCGLCGQRRGHGAETSSKRALSAAVLTLVLSRCFAFDHLRTSSSPVKSPSISENGPQQEMQISSNQDSSPLQLLTSDLERNQEFSIEVQINLGDSAHAAHTSSPLALLAVFSSGHFITTLSIRNYLGGHVSHKVGKFSS